MSEAMTVEQALEWLESLRNTTGDQVCAEIEAGKAAEVAQALRAALSCSAEPEGAEVWVLYDATADRKYIKKNVGDGCLAVFDYEHEAIDASGRHPDTAYKKMVLVPAPPTQEEQE